MKFDGVNIRSSLPSLVLYWCIRAVWYFATGNFRYSWKIEIKRLGHSKKDEINLVFMRMLLIKVTLDVNVVIFFQLSPQPCHFSFFSSCQAIKYTYLLSFNIRLLFRHQYITQIILIHHLKHLSKHYWNVSNMSKKYDGFTFAKIKERARSYSTNASNHKNFLFLKKSNSALNNTCVKIA